MRRPVLLLLLAAATLVQKAAAKKKRVGYRESDMKLFFPGDSTTIAPMFDENHPRFDPMADPIHHLRPGATHHELFLALDTSGDGLVQIEELKHKHKHTDVYPPDGHPGMSKEHFLKRHKGDFKHEAHGHALFEEHDADANLRLTPEEYKNVAPKLYEKQLERLERERLSQEL